MKIVSIDFETANTSRVSICAAGLALFEDGELAESLYWLVKPPKGHGWFREEFIECHHLTHLDVVNAPDFSEIAPEFLARIASADLVVAHNAEFDIGHLRGTLNHFGLVCPPFNYLCTCQLARRVWPGLPNHKLSTLAAHIGHAFNHHQALSDAEAAGRVIAKMMKQLNAPTAEYLFRATGISTKQF